MNNKQKWKARKNLIDLSDDDDEVMHCLIAYVQLRIKKQSPDLIEFSDSEVVAKIF